MAFTSRETGGTIEQHGMSVTMETVEIQGSSTGSELWSLTPAQACLVTHAWGCWTRGLPVYWSGGCTEVWAAGGREADWFWEVKDPAGVVTAVALLLGLTENEVDFSESGEIKRSELIRTRTSSDLNSEGHEEKGLGLVGARVLRHCLSFSIRLCQLKYKSCPSFLPRTTAEALLYNWPQQMNHRGKLMHVHLVSSVSTASTKTNWLFYRKYSTVRQILTKTTQLNKH